jgi:uncharacterized protein (TIRG00374 family)
MKVALLNNSRFRFAGKVIGTAALAAIVLSRIDLLQVKAVFRTADMWLLSLAFFLLLLRLPIIACRWLLLLQQWGYQLSAAYLTKVSFIAVFFALLLPGMSGMDLTRGLYLSRRSVLPKHAVGSVVCDRFAGIVSLVLLSIVPACYVLLERPTLWPVSLTIGLLSLGVGTGLVALLRLTPQDVATGQAVNGWRAQLIGLAAGFLADVASYVANTPLVAKTLGLSMGIQILGILATYVIGVAVGADIAFGYYVLFLPLIWLLLLIPVSINGIGVREGGFVFFFGLIGMPAEVALTISLTVLGQEMLQGLLGGVVLLCDRSAPHSQPAEQRCSLREED